MVFEHDGAKVGIQFRYNFSADEQRITSCCVYDKDTATVYGMGVATKSVNDRPNKEVARKVSLRRALDGLSREFRTAAWKAYHERKKIANNVVNY